MTKYFPHQINQAKEHMKQRSPEKVIFMSMTKQQKEEVLSTLTSVVLDYGWHGHYKVIGASHYITYELNQENQNTDRGIENA